jgi:hypothetical protein
MVFLLPVERIHSIYFYCKKCPDEFVAGIGVALFALLESAKQIRLVLTSTSARRGQGS